MEVSDRNRRSDLGSAGRRPLVGHGRLAGPDGRDGLVSASAVAEVLAIQAADLVGVLPGGRDTAALLSSVADALMQLEESGRH
jgi:hypothetical protein